MATRSTISIINLDGAVESIYCHWDGYYSHNGKILKENYTTESQVRDLIKLGNLSSLAALMHPTKPHTFEKPQKGVCVAYGRDRGEGNEHAKVFQNKEVMMKNNAQEYNYFFSVKSGKWHHRR